MPGRCRLGFMPDTLVSDHVLSGINRPTPNWAILVGPASVRHGLRQPLPVHFARVGIGVLRLLHLRGFDEALLLRPALVHALEAPIRAAARGANRLIADEHE